MYWSVPPFLIFEAGAVEAGAVVEEAGAVVEDAGAVVEATAEVVGAVDVVAGADAVGVADVSLPQAVTRNARTRTNAMGISSLFMIPPSIICHHVPMIVFI
jgi:hypothetical protein